MKKIKLVLLTLFVFGAISSCEDAYNITQAGELNEENGLKTVDNLQSYLNSVYGYVTTSNEIAFTAIFTDETGTGRGSGGQNFDTHRFQVTSANAYADAIWYGDYAAINRANRLLRAAALVTPDASIVDANGFTDVQRYNYIVAQAKAIRAFCHFQLLTYFSTNIADDSAPGVILMDRVPTIAEDLPRNTNGEVFALIESDLDFAYNNYINYYSPATAYKYVSKNMINALRARMYLYRGNYTLAQQYSEDVIANSSLVLTPAIPVPSPAPTNPNYSVFVASNPLTVGAPTAAWNTSFYGNASTNPYRKMFNDTAQGEIIFALDRPAAGAWENIAGEFATNTTNATGSPFFEVGRNLFNLLRSVPGDVRRYANVDPTSIIDPNYDQPGVNYDQTDVLIIDKYPGKTISGYSLRNDIKVFRLSEMYFILAECYAHNGSLNGASGSVASVLQLIRTKRNFLGAQPLPNYADANAALTDILLERRKELCFEGHRYIDLKRLGPVLGLSIDRNATDDAIAGLPTTLPITDYRFTLPIPTNEVNANTIIQQNPGYSN